MNGESYIQDIIKQHLRSIPQKTDVHIGVCNTVTIELEFSSEHEAVDWIERMVIFESV